MKILVMEYLERYEKYCKDLWSNVRQFDKSEKIK